MATTVSSSSSSSSSSSGADKVRFEIKKWNAVAYWQYDMAIEKCAICRNSLTELCLECQTENKSDGCKIAWGTCNHPFHNHCITKWLNTRNVCPLDNKPWELQKTN